MSSKYLVSKKKEFENPKKKNKRKKDKIESFGGYPIIIAYLCKNQERNKKKGVGGGEEDIGRQKQGEMWEKRDEDEQEQEQNK